MTAPPPRPTQRWGAVVLAWLLVGAPLAWGILQTVKKALRLFE